MENLKPAEILDVTIETAAARTGQSVLRLLILGFLAGSFIALAAAGSNTAACNLLMNPNSFGLGKVLSGAVFTSGLIMVILAGGELFTGNVLMFTAVVERKVSLYQMFRNWIIVYVANLLGALAVVCMLYFSGQLEGGAGILGALTVKTAVSKTNLSFAQAFLLGTLCNWLVCIAVWISFSVQSVTGKIAGMFFPIWLFVTAGFEHSIANMYFIPAGILAKGNETFVSLSGVTTEALSNLSWSGFFINNLIPVTLGNIVGGGVFVALAYWLAYRKA